MSQYFQIEQVADGVHAAIVTPGTGAWGNAGIIDLGGRTVVFDTFATPRAAADLRAAAEELTGQPVTLVINSHRTRWRSAPKRSRMPHCAVRR
jgi:cyclase